MIKTAKFSFRYYLSQIPNPVRQKSRQWGPTVAAIMLITFFIVFAIRPTIATIAELLAEIDAREELNEKLNDKIDQIVAAQTTYNQVYDQLYLVNQALPYNPEFAYFSQTLEGSRRETGLSLNTLNYSSIILTENSQESKKTDQDNQEFVFDTGLIGDYQNLQNFLADIFSQRRIIYIDNLDISQKTSDEEILGLVISLNGRAFYLGDE